MNRHYCLLYGCAAVGIGLYICLGFVVVEMRQFYKILHFSASKLYGVIHILNGFSCKSNKSVISLVEFTEMYELYWC